MKTTMKIRMMAAGAACLCAALSASATEWTYSTSTADGKTSTFITNDQWKLSLGGATLTKDSTAVTITWPSGWIDPKDNTKGVLDLRSPLTIKIGDDVATITSVALKNDWTGQTTWTANVVEFYCDILSSFPVNFFNNASKMTTLDIGGSATELPCPLLKDCTALETVKFDFPGLLTVGGSGSSLFSGTETKATNLQDIDVSMVAGPGVASVGKYALKCQKITGDLVLTNVATIAESAFQDTKLTSVSLAGTCTTLSKNAFGIVTSGLSGTITNVVLDLPSLSSIDSTAFTSQKKIRRVELVTALSSMNLLKNIVASADNSTFNELVIYVSTNQWTATASETYSDSNTSGIFRELTDSEKSTAPDGAFGVFVLNGTDKGVFVHKASYSDPEPIVEGTWTYSKTAKTITDGQWTFSVGDLTVSSNSITFAKGSLKSWKAPSDASKKGVLDLRSPFTIKIGDSQATITSVVLGEYMLSVVGSGYKDTAKDGVDNLSELYCDNVTSVGQGLCKNTGSLKNLYLTGTVTEMGLAVFTGAGITNVVFDLPNLKSLNDQTFADQTNIQSVHLLSVFADLSQAIHIVRNAGGSAETTGTAAQTGCRIYLSKRQWKKAARDAAKASEVFTSEFTDAEKEAIDKDQTLARAYGVVLGNGRRAFVVHEASPHDKIPAGTMLFFR